ncbi:hypothetical protein BK126_14145 [Paenibacillus sp. FSL H7-0326]|uniref:hypothetical protein n=1 Tax=Paenibacillus sp. FSL H7-0326 TaxID=1921144 RepID=UPI00096C2700|nr:hypothetical protein [Paenibacillus sp. FSL H7-0326]OMC68930.1 hypothetical protein BK126_14145 [Paenibacillus sp. FSL H7-0326]
MMPDFERKLLRILYNFCGQRRRMPQMMELEVKTGRTESGIRKALRELERQGFIKWQDQSSTEHIMILEGWEPEEQTPVRSIPASSDGMDYWTKY